MDTHLITLNEGTINFRKFTPEEIRQLGAIAPGAQLVSYMPIMKAAAVEVKPREGANIPGYQKPFAFDYVIAIESPAMLWQHLAALYSFNGLKPLDVPGQTKTVQCEVGAITLRPLPADNFRQTEAASRAQGPNRWLVPYMLILAAAAIVVEPQAGLTIPPDQTPYETVIATESIPGLCWLIRELYILSGENVPTDLPIIDELKKSGRLA